LEELVHVDLVGHFVLQFQGVREQDETLLVQQDQVTHQVLQQFELEHNGVLLGQVVQQQPVHLDAGGVLRVQVFKLERYHSFVASEVALQRLQNQRVNQKPIR